MYLPYSHVYLGTKAKTSPINKDKHVSKIQRKREPMPAIPNFIDKVFNFDSNVGNAQIQSTNTTSDKRKNRSSRKSRHKSHKKPTKAKKQKPKISDEDTIYTFPTPSLDYLKFCRNFNESIPKVSIPNVDEMCVLTFCLEPTSKKVSEPLTSNQISDAENNALVVGKGLAG